MFDVNQNIWKAHVTLIMIHFLVTFLSISYFVMTEREHFKTLKFHQRMLELIGWATIVPFSVSLGFGFILFGGVGLLWLYSVTG